MDKNPRDPVHCWLVFGKAFRAAAKYLYAGLEETGIDDTDFRILEVLSNKGPLPVNTSGPKVRLTPGSISTAVDRLVDQAMEALGSLGTCGIVRAEPLGTEVSFEEL